MLKERSLKEIKEADLLKLSELSRLLGESRAVLAKYVGEDILPFYIPEGKKAKYYKPEEVKKVLKLIAKLRDKRVYIVELKEELLKKEWYKELIKQ